MRIWKSIQVDLSIRQTDAISDFLGDWRREALATAPPGPVEVETNLGGIDEAGSPSLDFDWVATLAAEFPRLQVRVTHRTPNTRQEATAPYEVRDLWGMTTRRAWVEVQRPRHWIILED